MLQKNIYCSHFQLCVFSVAVAQQNPLLEKYRSMAVEYSHDLKAADKNIAASIELEKAAQKDLYPKLSGNANFQFTGNPLELTLDLPSMGNPVTFEGKDLKYGASVSLLQPVYTGGRLLETIRMAKYRHNVSGFQEEYIRSGIYLQTDMQYWNNRGPCRTITGCHRLSKFHCFARQKPSVNEWKRLGRPAKTYSWQK